MARRDDPIDALFRLPLAEFIGARKELAARLKKSGYAEEAATVKVLAKPPVSAWAVNQLYWNHRDAFDELIATGQRFRKAQTSGKLANMREALEARRVALSNLSDLATQVLMDAGHNPSHDTLRRITSTLEGLSAATSTAGPTPGRLTHDVDPPGFDSFGSFVPSAVTKQSPKRAPDSPGKTRAIPSRKSQQKASVTAEAAERAKRQARISATKNAVQNSKKELLAAQAQVRSLEAAHKRSEAAAKEAERQKRQAKDRFKKAAAAAEDAARRVKDIATELVLANGALEEGKLAVERATRELEASFRDPT